MNWDQIGALGEILGALGVIASVLYLAVQVRRDRVATLANTRQLRQNGVRESMLTLADSSELAKLLATMGQPQGGVVTLMDEFGLDREQAIRVNAYYISMFRQLETNLRMPMTDEEVKQTEDTIRFQIQGPAAVWWQTSKNFGFSADFVEKVNLLSKESQ